MEYRIPLAVHGFRGSQEGKGPHKVLNGRSNGMYYGDYTLKNAEEDWIEFNVLSAAPVVPTKIGIENNGSIHSVKAMILRGSTTPDRWDFWMEIENVKQSRGLQLFDIPRKEGMMAKQNRWKYYRMEIVENYGDENWNAFNQFQILGMDPEAERQQNQAVSKPHAPAQVQLTPTQTETKTSEEPVEDEVKSDWAQSAMKRSNFDEETTKTDVHIAVGKIAKAVAASAATLATGGAVPAVLAAGLEDVVINAGWSASDKEETINHQLFDENGVLYLELKKRVSSVSTGICCWKQEKILIQASTKVYHTKAVSTAAKKELKAMHNKKVKADLNYISKAQGLAD